MNSRPSCPTSMKLGHRRGSSTIATVTLGATQCRRIRCAMYSSSTPSMMLCTGRGLCGLHCFFKSLVARGITQNQSTKIAHPLHTTPHPLHTSKTTHHTTRRDFQADFLDKRGEREQTPCALAASTEIYLRDLSFEAAVFVACAPPPPPLVLEKKRVVLRTADILKKRGTV